MGLKVRKREDSLSIGTPSGCAPASDSELQGDLDVCVLERNNLVSELDSCQSSAQQVADERNSLVTERDDLVSKVSTLNETIAYINKSIETCISEKETISENIDSCLNEKDSLELDLSSAISDRDSLISRLNDIDIRLSSVLGRDIGDEDKLNKLDSDKLMLKSSIENKTGLDIGDDLSTYPSYIDSIESVEKSWEKPEDWIDMPEVSIIDGVDGDVFNGLFFVKDTGNKYDNNIMLRFTGDMIVDWGDGTVENVASRATVEHFYDFESIDSDELTKEGYKQVIVHCIPQDGSRLEKLETYLTVDGRKNNSFYEVQLYGDAITTMYYAFALYQTYIENADVYAPLSISLYSAFYMNSSLVQAKLRMKDVDTMKYCFRDCNMLKYADVTGTENLTSLNRSFATTSINELEIKTSNRLEDTGYMFSSNSRIEKQPNVNLENVSNMREMFRGSILEEVYIEPGIDASLNYMCYCAYNVKNIVIDRNIIDGKYLAGVATSLESMTINGTVENAELMLYYCINLKEFSLDMINTTNAYRMLDSVHRLEKINLTNCSVSTMIRYAYSLPSSEIDNFILTGLVDVSQNETNKILTITGTVTEDELSQEALDHALTYGWDLVF